METLRYILNEIHNALTNVEWSRHYYDENGNYLYTTYAMRPIHPEWEHKPEQQEGDTRNT